MTIIITATVSVLFWLRVRIRGLRIVYRHRVTVQIVFLPRFVGVSLASGRDAIVIIQLVKIIKPTASELPKQLRLKAALLLRAVLRLKPTLSPLLAHGLSVVQHSPYAWRINLRQRPC